MRGPVLFLMIWLAAGTDPSGVSVDAPSGDPWRNAPLAVETPEPPNTAIEVGAPAPDFSYLAADGRWRRLRDLTAHTSVLLVIAPHESQLRALERERDALLRLGVMPVAVLDARPNAVRKLADRLRLRYTVVADARHIIASQFNAVNPANLTTVPSWFVVDKSRTVRALRRGARLDRDCTTVAARALGLPLPDGVAPATR
jgi:peroxiredoxin